jgi:hypothetical protein
VEADPSQQTGGPAADGQVNLGIPQTDLAGLLKGGMVVLSQPGQAGDREAVVVLVNGEGYGPLDQPLDPRRDGWLLGKSTGHRRTLAHSPDGPAPRSADKQMQGQEFDVGAGHRRSAPCLIACSGGHSGGHSTRPYCSQPDRTQRNAFPT